MSGGQTLNGRVVGAFVVATLVSGAAVVLASVAVRWMGDSGQATSAVAEVAAGAGATSSTVETDAAALLLLDGVSEGASFDAGDTVTVSVTGVAGGERVRLLVDGVIVATADGEEPLSWVAQEGDHQLWVEVASGGESRRSETVTVSVRPAPATTAGRESALLVPRSVSATNVRAAVPRLRCGGSNDFLASYLIDGDPQTGWGASVGDGSGQSVTVDFGGEVALTRLGLAPGYLRVAPRSSEGCAATLAFDYNRFVERVEYRFDDGTTVEQAFQRRAEIQEIEIEPVKTTTVTITLLSTSRGSRADNDTVLSEAVFYGYRP